MLGKLRELAIDKYGLMNNEIRRKAWNILLVLDNPELTLVGEESTKSSREEFKRKNDYEKMKEEVKLSKAKNDVEVTDLIKEFEEINEYSSLSNDLTKKLEQHKASNLKSITKSLNEETKEMLTEKAWKQTKGVIGRTMYKFDFFNSLNEETAEKYKTNLEQIMHQLLTKNKFQFYQGYNEFCCVFLLILGKKQGAKAAEVASHFFLRDFLQDSFESKVEPMLYMVNDILKVAVSEFYKSFIKIGVNVYANVDAYVLFVLDINLVCS
jgi:hypothetical protein